MRFITTLVQIGQIAQAYQLTWCFDCRQVLLEWLRLRGLNPATSYVYGSIRFLTGWAIKLFGLFVVVQQERGRVIRWTLNNHYKQDSGLEAYNMFNGRSEIYGTEQPESVYFMDKFMQPTHLYLHSSPLDYGGQIGDKWDQTVVVYEAFRAPMFIPAHIREAYE